MRVGARTWERSDDLPEEWEAVVPRHFAFQRDFLGVMERSGVADARYRYLLLRGPSGLVGAAVLSRFVLRLDLLSGSRMVRAMRHLSPALFDFPVVFCGIPASFGQCHFHVTDPACRVAAFEAVDDAMGAWASEEECGGQIWKEWEPGHGLSEAARSRRYTVLPTLPDHVLENLPRTPDGLADTMRSSYRRKLRVATALMDGPGPFWRRGPFWLRDERFTELHAEEFHEGYLAVLARTPVRLETYPRAFFEGLARSSVAARRLTIGSDASGETMSALVLPGGDTLWFGLISKPQPRYADALYALLLRCIVVYAVKRGYRSVRLGQTSPYAKCAAGARPVRLETFVQLRTPWKNRLLSRHGSLLFPEVESPTLRVFRSESDPASRTSSRGLLDA